MAIPRCIVYNVPDNVCAGYAHLTAHSKLYSGGMKMEIGENFKGLLMYTGSRDNEGKVIYPEFSKEDIKKLIEIGINEFIILDGGLLYNYYIEDGEYKPILTMKDVDDLDRSVTELTTPGWHERFQGYYRDRISRITEGRNLNDYVQRSAALAERIAEVDPDAHIWLSFPAINVPGLTDKFTDVYKKYVFGLGRQLISDRVWEHNIRGYYFSTEDIVNDFTVFNYEDDTYNSDFNNPIVKLIKALSETVHADGKKMVWIPYYRTGGWAENGKRLGYMANRTDFFDYVVIQSSYYFDPNTDRNVDVIKESVERQTVVDFYHTPFGGGKISSTVIGPEMEIAEDGDSNVSEEERRERYLAYEKAYKGFVGKHPIIYYAADRNSVMKDIILGYLKNFYN